MVQCNSYPNQTEVKPLPALSELQSLFYYEASTGKLYRAKTTSASAIRGQEVNYSSSNGYLQVRIRRSPYAVHRIIWYLNTGIEPGNLIVDHIDGNKQNNRIENLRLATSSQNRFNQKIRKDNSSGYKGVAWVKDKNKFRAVIHFNGKCKFLGYYKTAIEAHQAYCSAAEKYHKEFKRLR